MRGALEGVAGIGRVDIEAGAPNFTVHYDAAKIKPEEIVAKLVAAGKDAAKIAKP